MILDTLDNLKHYAGVHRYVRTILEFLNNHNLAEMPIGKVMIAKDSLYVNVCDSAAKTKSEARLETHNKYIDLQIPLSAPEQHGWTPRAVLPEAEYDKKNDISFYEGEAEKYFTVQPGQFVIYLPGDAHAPAISETGLRKAIFKLKV